MGEVFPNCGGHWFRDDFARFGWMDLVDIEEWILYVVEILSLYPNEKQRILRRHPRPFPCTP